MWLAFVVEFFALREEILRRKLEIDPQTVIVWMVIAGILGAKLWHILDTPADWPTLDTLTSRAILGWFQSGFAWFGGFTAGIAALLYLGRKYRTGMLAMLEICSPAAAIGYAVGRIGCLISGDGDYGIPTNLPWGMAFPNGLVPTTQRVHPTPIYEFLVGVIIFWYLWRLGARSLLRPRPRGEVIGEYFVWTGLARFLVEFIRINPRSVFGVLSNAQLIALLSIVAGLIILFSIRRRFKGESQERRIARHSSERGDAIQPEYHQATPECPDPQQWKMYDSMTAEVEVLEFLGSLVTTLKPKLVVETGTFMGISTLWIAEGLKRNGAGKVITCETDPLVYAKAQDRIATSGLAEWIDSRNQP